jgi:hypothetical protein
MKAVEISSLCTSASFEANTAETSGSSGDGVEDVRILLVRRLALCRGEQWDCVVLKWVCLGGDEDKYLSFLR